jgi:hypothetical protein
VTGGTSPGRGWAICECVVGRDLGIWEIRSRIIRGRGEVRRTAPGRVPGYVDLWAGGEEEEEGREGQVLAKGM